MNEASFLPRLLTPLVEEALRRFPVVIVTGARQTGKSTLVQRLPSSGDRRYYTLDDLYAGKEIFPLWPRVLAAPVGSVL